MTTRDEQVLVRLSGDLKEDLEDHVSDDDVAHDSVSELMRYGALMEKEGHYLSDELEEILGDVDLDADVDPDEIANAVEIGLSDVSERIERMDQQITDLKEKMSESEELTNLAQELKSKWLLELPHGMSILDLEIHLGTESKLSDHELARISGSAQEIADQRETQSVGDIRSALRRAHEIYPRVKRVLDEENSRTRYWVSNPEKQFEEMTEEEIEEIVERHGGFETGLDVQERNDGE